MASQLPDERGHVTGQTQPVNGSLKASTDRHLATVYDDRLNDEYHQVTRHATVRRDSLSPAGRAARRSRDARQRDRMDCECGCEHTAE
jgi:hypothetical protein